MLAESTTHRLETSSTSERERLRHLVAEAGEPIAQFWPMKDFVHHNPLHGLEHLPFAQAVREARGLLGGNGYLSNSEYRRLFRQGRITPEGVRQALLRVGPRVAGPTCIQAGSRRIEAGDVWRAQLLHDLDAAQPEDVARNAQEACLQEVCERAVQAAPGGSDGGPAAPAEVSLPAQRTIGDWLDMLADASIVERINDQMTKWVAAFVDEGMAGWEMPGRHDGFYAAWRNLAPLDFSGAFLQIQDFSRKVRDLPVHPEDAIALSLRRMEVPEERWREYLSRHLAQLPGWAGFIRWLGENPAYPGQAGHPADPVQYLAVRLFYEVQLAAAFCRRRWGVAGTLPALASHWEKNRDGYRCLVARQGPEASGPPAWRLCRLAQCLALGPDDVGALSSPYAGTLLRWMDAFPEDQHGPVWLEAYEDKFRKELLATLAAHPAAAAESGVRPRAQIVLCIDVRSESFRRHIEAQGPDETYGFAGFFGVAMNYRAFDSGERFPLCPVLLKPSRAVDEAVRPDQPRAVQSYASGTRWRQLGDHLFHGLKQNPVASFLLVDLLGFFFGLGLTGKTLFPGLYERIRERIRGWFHPVLPTRILVDQAGENGAAASSGFPREEQVSLVENGLRAIGLTRRFGRFVVLCGHGSISDNNPYFGALHCGACGGKHGDPNARAFAAMGNNPEVRRLLRDRGLDIPGDTWFLGAKHITTSDRIVLYDVEDVPATHREDLQGMLRDWEQAGASQALERCGRLPGTRRDLSADEAYQHVAARTADWSNTRPEWGLSSNAAFLVGRRRLTRAVALQGRVFLHSYDPEQDPEGRILEKIMTAPLIVGEWINMEHYFSAVDPWFWGSGSKVIHNVVSGVGVMLGSQGDLQTGLPLQTVNHGSSHYHEPMRLLTIIEGPTSRISQVIRKHQLLQQLFHNQWLNLVAVDPVRPEFQRYNPDGTWEPVARGGDA